MSQEIYDLQTVLDMCEQLSTAQVDGLVGLALVGITLTFAGAVVWLLVRK